MVIVASPPSRPSDFSSAPRRQNGAGPCGFLAARPSEQDLQRLAAGGESVRVKRGDHLFSEGDVVDAVYVIRRGRIALGGRVRGRRVVLLLLHEGDILGDVPMLLQTPASFDALAETDAELVAIPAGRLLATLDQSPEFARRWLLWLSGRLSSAHTRLLSLLAGDVRAQVVALLVQESCRGDTIRLTHHEIASMVGAQRSSVTRALDGLSGDGMIETGYGQVRILDPHRLAAASRSMSKGETAPAMEHGPGTFPQG